MGSVVLGLCLGCAPRKPVTERDRTEAAHVASEAQFAVSVREWDRAEKLLARAVELAPQGDYWLSLGATRVHLNDRAGAKDAYRSALKAYAAESARPNATSELWIKHAYVLALLGRPDESRALIAQATERFPHDGQVRALNDAGEFEKMVSSQKFKDMAL
jgi:tetratricopeptide (TPR) repeat protein